MDQEAPETLSTCLGAPQRSKTIKRTTKVSARIPRAVVLDHGMPASKHHDILVCCVYWHCGCMEFPLAATPNCHFQTMTPCTYRSIVPRINIHIHMPLFVALGASRLHMRGLLPAANSAVVWQCTGIRSHHVNITNSYAN